MVSVYTQINPKNERFTYYCNRYYRAKYNYRQFYTSTYLTYATFFFICGLSAIDVCDIGTIVMHEIDLNTSTLHDYFTFISPHQPFPVLR